MNAATDRAYARWISNGLCALAIACGSGGAGGAGHPAAAGAPAAGAGSTGAARCLAEEEINLDCPPKAPLDGECGQRGACCHRTSNRAKERALGPDDPLVLEYRVQSQLTINHPDTIGNELITDSQRTRYDNQSQNLLWRFELPRSGGALVAGAARVTYGYGVYDCDGSYRYFGAAAAPPRPASSDPARWAPKTVDASFDPVRLGAERLQFAFAGDRNRELTHLPYLVEETFALDWELVTQGMRLREIALDETDRDCIGSREGGVWTAGGTFEVYTPLDRNDQEVIASIGETYCQLVAFGLIAAEDAARLSCADTPRCAPGTAGCAWKKLPDSLCPVTETEMALWGCHLGARGNPNAEPGYPDPLDCTEDAPASALDPQAGATSSGQCCDPMGTSTTLPACNAYRLIQSYVAAAAEITDEPAQGLPAQCR